MTYLDTHVAVWLYIGDEGKLGEAAKGAIEADEVVVSPAVVLELDYLHSIGRLVPGAREVMDALGNDIGLTVCQLPFHTIVEHALTEKWTRDPFDRLIVANAKAAGAALLSQDERIRENYSKTIW